MERKQNKRQRRRYSELKAYERPSSSSECSLFTPASTYPSFFDQNLLDDDRKIKIFKDNPHAHETIFYFQLLKLIFECEDSNYEKYLQKIYDVLDNPEFELAAPRLGSKYCLGLSSAKMKKLIAEFLEQMGQGEMTVEEGLRKYPIVHKLMVIFFRSVLLVADHCSTFDQEVDPAQVYELLGSYFQLEITYYGNCLRFNQVDVFVYLHENNEVYLAYVSPAISQQEILSSSELYQNDPSEAFNISSVKQMVSEIDIPVDTDCFDSSKHQNNLDDTEEIEYNYSQSEEVRGPSRSLQEPSQLKFSYLISDESIQNLNVIKSNKILEKEVIGEKRNIGARFAPQIECYQIEEVPLQLQNAVSPTVTPRETKFVAFSNEQCRKFDQANIYRKKKSTNIRDIIREEYELLSTYQSCFKQKEFQEVLKDTADTDWGFRKDGPAFLEELEPNKPTVTLRSLYDGKSIKSICASDGGQSYLIGQTPAKISKFSSRTQTVQNKLEENIEPTKSKNASGDFTSSFVLRQMQEPYQGNIRSMKLRARDNRQNVRKLALF